MVEPTLQRQKSTVPTSTTNFESTVLDKPIGDLWNSLKAFDLATLAPGAIESTEWTDGEAGKVGSLVTVKFKNGSSWTYQITEVSDKQHNICYTLAAADPAIEASSLEGEISLLRVTDGNQTYLRWTTEYSNDADAEMIQDQKFKKMDLFAEIKKHL